MTWIFEGCPDEYGECIRQYALFGLSLIVLLLAFYSCIRVYGQQQKFTFQLLPLLINTLTALMLVGFYTQMEVFNIRIALLIIELYSYFILSYGFIYMVTKHQPESTRQLKFVKKIFVVFTLACVLGLVGVAITANLDIITCEEDQGIGATILIGLQVPLLIVICIYSRKSKTILIKGGMQYSNTTQQRDHLLNQQEQQRRVKLLQLKLIRYSFALTFLLHIIEVVFFYVGEGAQEDTCSDNKVVVTNLLTFYVLSIESVSQILPHFMIPIIFWYLPLRYLKRAVTLYMSHPNVLNSRNEPLDGIKFRKQQSSNYVAEVQEEEEIRKRLNESPSRKMRKVLD